MMLAGVEAIAARAQPPAKGGNIFSLKNCPIQFVWDGYLLHVWPSPFFLRLPSNAFPEIGSVGQIEKKNLKKKQEDLE